MLSPIELKTGNQGNIKRTAMQSLAAFSGSAVKMSCLVEQDCYSRVCPQDQPMHRIVLPFWSGGKEEQSLRHRNGCKAIN